MTTVQNPRPPTIQHDVVASDITVNNSTTLVDALEFEALANKKYMVFASLHFDSGATPDIKFGWSVPSGAAGNWNMQHDNVQNGLGSTDAVSCSGNDSTMLHAGIVIGGTAGTVKLQFAQNTADASDTDLMAGSSLIAVQVD
jgi:hypothetical protein